MGLFTELKRRNVFKVAAAYIIIGWLILQVGEVLAPALRLPDWVNSMLAFFILLGFPLALFFAWAFELTPEGLRKEKDVAADLSISSQTGRKLNWVIVGLLVLAVGYIGWDKMAGGSGSTAPATAMQDSTPMIQEAKTTPGDLSIAVLPFQNRSADEENAEFFSDGIHDEILTNLSKIDSLKVISRTSVMGYRDTEKNMKQIGDELGVATILEGGVQRAGNQVRINVQLIDAETDEHVWAEIYNRELTAENLFAIQSEVAESIASALQATMSPEEQALIESRPTNNLEAYEHYLVAKQLFARQNWDSLESAKAGFEQAIALDPEFHLAWESLAWTQLMQVNTGAKTFPAVRDSVKEAIDRALELAPNSGGSHAVQASFLIRANQGGGPNAFDKALELDPHNVEIMMYVATNAREWGDPERSLEILEQARQLDPMSTRVWFGMGRTYMQLDRPRDAIEAHARIRAIDPSSSNGKGPAAGTYLVLGDKPNSLYWLFQGWEADPQDMDLPNWIVREYLDLRDLEIARAWLDQIAAESRSFAFTQSHQAMFHVYDGSLDSARKMAEDYYGQEFPNHRWGSDSVMVNVLLMAAVANNNAGEVLEFLSQHYSDIMGDEKRVRPVVINQVVDIAHLYILDGQHEEAKVLLNKCLEVVREPYALTGDTNMWRISVEAQALALLGETEAAISNLQALVDKGWRVLWHWQLVMNPNFNSIRDEPEFQAIVQEIEEDMARQRIRLQAMIDAGEIPPPPEAGS